MSGFTMGHQRHAAHSQAFPTSRTNGINRSQQQAIASR